MNESQGGGQQSAPQGGEELRVGPPNPGNVLNVPEDWRFLHGRLTSENLPGRARLKNSGPRKGRSNNERVGQKAQHDADNGKDQGGHRIGISLAQLVRGPPQADQAYHAGNQGAGRDRDGADVVDRSLERRGYRSLSLEQ